jgi:cytidyltransferase-like protein
MPHQSASLFVGRWQPFHRGHKDLIETVLKKGKSVVIAIRDTEINSENPYTTSERWNMIQRALKKYGELVKIIVIPDIDEICYGRDVGYKIREIELSSKKQQVSGTAIRKNTIKRYPIYWITGQSGSGKTTLAYALREKIGGAVLDGDEMRESISLGLGFSKEDRENHNLRVARLALTLSRQAVVIISVIAPFESTRKEIDDLIKPFWIYIARNLPKDPNKPYEAPSKPHIMVNSDIQTPDEQIERVIGYIEKHV